MKMDITCKERFTLGANSTVLKFIIHIPEIENFVKREAGWDDAQYKKYCFFEFEEAMSDIVLEKTSVPKNILIKVSRKEFRAFAWSYIDKVCKTNGWTWTEDKTLKEFDYDSDCYWA